MRAYLLDLPGLIAYDEAFALQERLVEARRFGLAPDTVVQLEHPPVITLGRRAETSHILAPAEVLAREGITVHHTNRGGLATYHGPGQLVVYPILQLEATRLDVPGYVGALEEVIIRVCADWGVAARREPGLRGVWAGAGKIAAIGVAIVHGITMHGYALNVAPNLAHFALINPCGLGERGVTSLARERGAAPPMAEVRAAAAHHFGAVFGRELEAVERDTLLAATARS